MRYNHFDMLPERAFQPVGKRMTLEGGSGGGSQTSTSTTSNLPTYAQPYYQELLKQTGKNVFNTDKDGFVTGVRGANVTSGMVGQVNPVTGKAFTEADIGTSAIPQRERVGMQDLTKRGIAGIAGLETPGQFARATEGLSSTQQLGMDTANQGFGQAFAYNPRSAQNFGSNQAQQYMNPFQQNVTDMALREAQQQGDIQRQAGAMGAIGRGTFGGARQALMQAEGDRNLMRTMGDIQAQGSQQAFQNAQQQFNADQARQQQAEQYSATLGAQLGERGITAGMDSSRLLGAMGTEQQAAELSRLQAKVAAGEKEQAQKQGETDTDYQNRMTALNFEKQELQFYSDILRGNAGALGSTSVQYAPAPSFASQAVGVGLGGLGLAKALG